MESFHQTKLFHTASLHEHLLPELLDFYAVPNGGHRAKATARSMKLQGQKPGVPDTSLDVPRRGFAGLKLELKRFREGDVEPEQDERLTRLARSGYRAIVCWGWVAAWEEVLWYLSREDLLLPSNRPTTAIVAAYPDFPYWHRCGNRYAESLTKSLVRRREKHENANSNRVNGGAISQAPPGDSAEYSYSALRK